jgi:hypothetical protein
MSDMKVVVEVRTVYGVDKFYPVNPASLIFAEINGAKTLSRRTINLIKELGYVVEVKSKVVVL